MTTADNVRVHKMACGDTEYDCITIDIAGLKLRCDAINDRTIRLAKKLADEHEAEFCYSDELAERVQNALRGRD